MIIALDFDDTYTAAPELWDEFIRIAQQRGHRIICVTCRRDTDENRDECRIPSLVRSEHYFTSHSPKRWYMEQRGMKVDVFIDDFPESVKEGR